MITSMNNNASKKISLKNFEPEAIMLDGGTGAQAILNMSTPKTWGQQPKYRPYGGAETDRGEKGQSEGRPNTTQNKKSAI